MADVQVGLGAVVGDEHLTVLERVHRARVDVEVGVELLHGDPQAARLEQRAQAGGRQALAERGGDTPGDEDVLGRRGFGRHGQEGAPVVAIVRCVPACPARDVRGCRRCGSGAPVPARGGHRSTGYQGISDRARPLPATLRTRGRHGSPRTHVVAHPFGAVRGCRDGRADHQRASYPARTLAAEPGRQTAPPRPSPEHRARQSFATITTLRRHDVTTIP